MGQKQRRSSYSTRRSGGGTKAAPRKASYDVENYIALGNAAPGPAMESSGAFSTNRSNSAAGGRETTSSASRPPMAMTAGGGSTSSTATEQASSNRWDEADLADSYQSPVQSSNVPGGFGYSSATTGASQNVMGDSSFDTHVGSSSQAPQSSSRGDANAAADRSEDNAGSYSSTSDIVEQSRQAAAAQASTNTSSGRAPQASFDPSRQSAKISDQAFGAADLGVHKAPHYHDLVKEECDNNEAYGFAMSSSPAFDRKLAKSLHHEQQRQAQFQEAHRRQPWQEQFDQDVMGTHEYQQHQQPAGGASHSKRGGGYGSDQRPQQGQGNRGHNAGTVTDRVFDTYPDESRVGGSSKGQQGQPGGWDLDLSSEDALGASQRDGATQSGNRQRRHRHHHHKHHHHHHDRQGQQQSRERSTQHSRQDSSTPAHLWETGHEFDSQTDFDDIGGEQRGGKHHQNAGFDTHDGPQEFGSRSRDNTSNAFDTYPEDAHAAPSGRTPTWDQTRRNQNTSTQSRAWSRGLETKDTESPRRYQQRGQQSQLDEFEHSSVPTEQSRHPNQDLQQSPANLTNWNTEMISQGASHDDSMPSMGSGSQRQPHHFHKGLRDDERRESGRSQQRPFDIRPESLTYGGSREQHNFDEDYAHRDLPEIPSPHPRHPNQDLQRESSSQRYQQGYSSRGDENENMFLSSGVRRMGSGRPPKQFMRDDEADNRGFAFERSYGSSSGGGGGSRQMQAQSKLQQPDSHEGFKQSIFGQSETPDLEQGYGYEQDRNPQQSLQAPGPSMTNATNSSGYLADTDRVDYSSGGNRGLYDPERGSQDHTAYRDNDASGQQQFDNNTAYQSQEQQPSLGSRLANMAGTGGAAGAGLGAMGVAAGGSKGRDSTGAAQSGGLQSMMSKGTSCNSGGGGALGDTREKFDTVKSVGKINSSNPKDKLEGMNAARKLTGGNSGQVMDTYKTVSTIKGGGSGMTGQLGAVKGMTGLGGGGGDKLGAMDSVSKIKGLGNNGLSLGQIGSGGGRAPPIAAATAAAGGAAVATGTNRKHSRGMTDIDAPSNDYLQSESSQHGGNSRQFGAGSGGSGGNGQYTNSRRYSTGNRRQNLHPTMQNAIPEESQYGSGANYQPATSRYSGQQRHQQHDMLSGEPSSRYSTMGASRNNNHTGGGQYNEMSNRVSGWSGERSGGASGTIASGSSQFNRSGGIGSQNRNATTDRQFSTGGGGSYGQPRPSRTSFSAQDVAQVANQISGQGSGSQQRAGGGGGGGEGNAYKPGHHHLFGLIHHHENEEQGSSNSEFAHSSGRGSGGHSASNHAHLGPSAAGMHSQEAADRAAGGPIGTKSLLYDSTVPQAMAMRSTDGESLETEAYHNYYLPGDRYSTGHTYGLAGAQGGGTSPQFQRHVRGDTNSTGNLYGLFGARGLGSPQTKCVDSPGADLDPNSTGREYGLLGTKGEEYRTKNGSHLSLHSSSGGGSPCACGSPYVDRSSSYYQYGLGGAGGPGSSHTDLAALPRRHPTGTAIPDSHPLGTKHYNHMLDHERSGLAMDSNHPPGTALPVEIQNATYGQTQQKRAGSFRDSAQKGRERDQQVAHPPGTTVDIGRPQQNTLFDETYRYNDTHPPGTTVESHPFPGDRERARMVDQMRSTEERVRGGGAGHRHLPSQAPTGRRADPSSGGRGGVPQESHLADSRQANHTPGRAPGTGSGGISSTNQGLPPTQAQLQQAVPYSETAGRDHRSQPTSAQPHHRQHSSDIGVPTSHQQCDQSGRRKSKFREKLDNFFHRKSSGGDDSYQSRDATSAQQYSQPPPPHHQRTRSSALAETERSQVRPIVGEQIPIPSGAGQVHQAFVP
ncbi:hypothetical protein H4R35_000292 [Dimargaris xerosporica]|nr:hypothetical protein H4R35_000292 [Dimargaris xerosporica]